MCVINLPTLSKRLVEDQRYLEKKEQIREEHSIKRIERKTKHDDIKRKYGLKTGDDDEVGS
jgi:predicted GIY-YIG superfamily endonuclease